MQKTQVKVIVQGLVQGVFFRAETKKAADNLGVRGFVRNLPDLSVEAVFEGEESIVNQMIEWCHKGSPSAIVNSVETKPMESISNFETFDIRY